MISNSYKKGVGSLEALLCPLLNVDCEEGTLQYWAASCNSPRVRHTIYLSGSLVTCLGCHHGGPGADTMASSQDITVCSQTNNQIDTVYC